MKSIMKIEMRKAIRNKMFLIAILIGCLITIFSFTFCLGLYQEDIEINQMLSEGQNVIINPGKPANTLFNRWIGGEPFSFGSSAFFFIFPLLAALPYGWSYCEEKRNGYVRAMVVRTGKWQYYISKYVVVFLSGGLAVTIPLVFNFVMAAMFFPAILPNVNYCVFYGVFAGSLFSTLYYTNPFLYVLLYLVIDFLFCGVIACIGLAVTSVVSNKVISIIIPFFVIMGIHYARQFVYTIDVNFSYEISPFYFLRPVQSAYPASLCIIVVEFVTLFVITFLVTNVWEKTHEIY